MQTPNERSEPISAPPQANSITPPANERKARRYVEQLRAFYVHAGVVAAGMLVIFTVNLLANLSAGSAVNGRRGGRRGHSSAGVSASPSTDSSSGPIDRCSLHRHGSSNRSRGRLGDDRMAGSILRPGCRVSGGARRARGGRPRTTDVQRDEHVRTQTRADEPCSARGR